MRRRLCPVSCWEITLLFGAQVQTLKAARGQRTDSTHPGRAEPTGCRLSAATATIPACSDVTLSAGAVQLCKVHAQPSTLNSLHTPCASSDPGALHHDGPRHHIIHSPIVLEEQQCDEGREEEGDGKVLVQGADS